jgi:xanthine/uracil permease
VLEALFGIGNGLRWVKRVFSPMVIGLVVAMVGLGLWPVVNDFIGHGWPYAIGLRADITSSRNEIIIGTSLLLGLALPAYMKENPVAVRNATLQVFLNVFLATPMMVAGTWAFILDNVIPGTAKERGLGGWLGASARGAASPGA